MINRKNQAVGAQCQAGIGGDNVGIVVLGAGAPEAQVHDWLTMAATNPRYTGFAVGRTIWWESIAAFRAGKLDRQECVEAIARRYREFVQTWRDSADGA